MPIITIFLLEQDDQTVFILAGNFYKNFVISNF